jgi:pilus assembly protein Flp/PilA
MLRALRERLVRFLTSEDGPTPMEYAVMVALIVVLSLASISFLGGRTIPAFGTAGKAFNSAGKSGSS